MAAHLANASLSSLQTLQYSKKEYCNLEYMLLPVSNIHRAFITNEAIVRVTLTLELFSTTLKTPKVSLALSQLAADNLL